MKRLSLFLLCLSVVLGYIGLADCTCCGLNGSSCCNPDAIANSIVSNCQNACSSNCVKLTPETCLQVKNDISTYLDGISNQVYDLQNMAYNIDIYGRQCIAIIDNAKQELQSAKTLLQQGNDAKSFLISARDSLISFSNNWHSVQSSGLGGFTRYVYVTNNFTGAYAQIGGLARPVQQVGFIIPLIENSISSIDRREENEIPTAIQSIDQSLIYLNQLHDSNETGYLDILLEDISALSAYADDLVDDCSALGNVLESFDCAPCGKGASNSGDDGGGGGGTQDMTPILAELQALRERLDYWMDKFYELIKRYFQDYNSAADSPLSVVDFDSYSASKNWFERVEMLLFSMSKINEDITEPVPEKPDGADELEDFMSSSEQDSETQNQDLKSTFDSSLQEVTDALDSFYHSWDSFSIPFSNFDGQIILSNPSETASWDFSVPTGTSSILQTMRNIFEVFWYIVVAFLYYSALYFLVKVTIKYVLWFIQFSSSTFGD